MWIQCQELEAALNLEKEKHGQAALNLETGAIDVPDRVCRTAPWCARYGADAPPGLLDFDPLIPRTSPATGRGNESAPCATRQVPEPKADTDRPACGAGRQR